MTRILLRNRDEYFSLQALSNSALTDIADKANDRYKPARSEAAMSYGTLVDALLTQTRDVDTMHELYGKALKAKSRFLSDPFCKLVYESAEKQVAYTDEVEWNYNEMTGRPFCKCLYDFDISPSAGADLKTVSASTYKAFLGSVDMFDWDRQAAFYLAVSGKDRFSILGISKTADVPPFVLHIKKGDEIYWRGRDKMMNLMFLHSMVS